MILSVEAQADIREATTYYDGQREGLGDEFIASIEQALESIEAMPEARRVVYRNMRRAAVRRFPFAVYYRIDGGEVVVLAVTHNRRDPRSWRSRG